MSSSSNPIIDIKVTTDVSDATKGFDKLASESKEAGKKIGDNLGKDGAGWKKAEEGFDSAEMRVMGFRDGLTGTADVMKGFRDGDVLTLAMGVGDLASAFANLGVETIKQVVTQGKAAASFVASKAAMVASAAATKAVTAAQWLLNAAMNANPLLLVVTAIAALTAAFIVAYKESETFRNIVNGAFEAVKNVVMGVYNWVKDNWPLLLAILTGPFGLAVLAISKHWDEIKGFAEGALTFFKELPGRLAEALGDTASTLLEKGKDLVRGLGAGIYEVFLSLATWFVNLPGVFAGWFADAATWLVQAGKDLIAGLVKGIADAPFNVAQAIADKIGDKVPVTIPAGGLGGDVFSKYGIEGQRASGGPVWPGTWLVGEKGPELLTIGGSGSVTPNSSLGGTTYVFNVSGFFGSEAELGRELQRLIDKNDKRNGRA